MNQQVDRTRALFAQENARTYANAARASMSLGRREHAALCQAQAARHALVARVHLGLE